MKRLFAILVAIMPLLLGMIGCGEHNGIKQSNEDDHELIAIEQRQKTEETSEDTNLRGSEADKTEELNPSSDGTQVEAVQAEENNTLDVQSNGPVSGKENVQQPQSQKKQQEKKYQDECFIAVTGSGVESPVNITLDDMRKMEDAVINTEVFSINSWGTKEYFQFIGVNMAKLFEQYVKLLPNASEVNFVAEDGYQWTCSVQELMRQDYIDEQNPEVKYPLILAWHERGKDYDPKDGAPFRLVVGQKEPGDVNKPSWVSNIKTIEVK